MSKTHVFSEVPQINIPRSVFRRPFDLKTTIGADYLYPIYVDEALPGDTFSCEYKLFGRLSTPVVPIMDDLYLDTFFFAVPIRLIDENWKKIIAGEGTYTNPNNDTFNEVTVPTMTTTPTTCSLSDYLGLPVGVEITICPYWHRAYNLIWNEYFRDENLQSYALVGGKTPAYTDPSGELPLHYPLRLRCKTHDYFTSCLPWPQKGNPVTIGINESAPVFGDGAMKFSMTTSNDSVRPFYFYERSKANITGYQPIGRYEYTPVRSDDSSLTVKVGETSNMRLLTKTQANAYNLTSGLFADLSQAQSITINDLRSAFATQRFMERSALCGSRYIEAILGHFNVLSPDARMQRPEYLGGTSNSLDVNSVPQTSGTPSNPDTSAGSTPQGNLAAFVTGSNHAFWKKSFTEHCVILGLANIRGTISYQYGIPRMFSRRTKYDFYWPEFANLGEQAVLNKEIFAQGNSQDDGVFGYQERWAEYRYHPNMITSFFRSNATATVDGQQVPQSLNYWHLAQTFANLPRLNEEFIQSNTPVYRCLAVQRSKHQQFILNGYFDVNCARPMPLYSVPSLQRL